MQHPARVRVVATDLDGTLLRDDRTISARTQRALRRARADGLATVMVTARPPRRVRALAGALDLGVAFAIEAGLRFGYEDHYLVPAEHAEDRTTGLRSHDAIELCGEGVTKLIVQHPEHPLDALLALVANCAGLHARVTHSGSAFVEVSAASVSKAAALAEYCAELGADASEVIAVGDMPNDIPMLRWSGWAVAVANAHPDVLDACDARTTSNNEEGVAALLETLAAQGYAMPQRTA